MLDDYRDIAEKVNIALIKYQKILSIIENFKNLKLFPNVNLTH